MATGQSGEVVKAIKEVLSKYPKDEVLKVIYELLSEKDSENQAKIDFLSVAERLLQITYKWFLFRVNEYTNQGLLFSYDVRYDKRWDGISMTIDLKFPKDQVMDLARWHEFIRLARLSDAQVKKTAMKRLDFISAAGEEAGEVREVPKDRLVEEAGEKYGG